MAVTSERMPWEPLLDRGEGEQLVARSSQRAQSALIEPIPDSLHPELREALAAKGFDGLYAHQADTLASAYEGHTIVTTGTASGKSLAFNLPVLDTLAHDRSARAFYLYPTKALAQDQARALHSLKLGYLRPAIYDGDTPQEERRAIRRRTNLVLTNPDMLHVGVLPNHAPWGDFLANLAWIVVDEAHVYRGVFGSHVANVLRRLRRLAMAYGTEPRFVLASATIANPVELAEHLTGCDVRLVDRDGAPRARREIAMWNPPLIDERTGARASPLAEAADLVADLVEKEVRTICFLRSRRGVELILKFARLRLEERGRADLAELISPYRAGYTPAQRREIESRLVNGDLLAVISTDALELGIDVGELDAAVCVTFPGTVASLRQMWGRAGRRATGLALYVAGADALDQFFCRHPEEFLDRPVESAILDPESEEIFLAHLVAAAYELPLSPGDEEFLGPRWQAAAQRLVKLGLLRERGGRYLPRGDDFPARRIALRSASPDSVAVVESEGGEMIGSVETARAHSAVHPGAIYLHMGRSYEVGHLDLHARHALVRPFAGDWYTQPKKETETQIERVEMTREVGGSKDSASLPNPSVGGSKDSASLPNPSVGGSKDSASLPNPSGTFPLSFGTVSVTEQVTAFQRKRVSDHEVLDLVALDMPEERFATQALWYELPDLALGAGGGAQHDRRSCEHRSDPFPLDVLQGSLHAAEHAQIAVLPLIAMCDRWDIGGLSTAFHAQTGRATVFIYDGHPGGVGITRLGFHRFEDLVRDALRLVGECPCRAGCPSCVQSPKCGNLNEPLNKNGALELLTRLHTR